LALNAGAALASSAGAGGSVSITAGAQEASANGGNVELTLGESASGTNGDFKILDSAGVTRVATDEFNFLVTTLAAEMTASSGTVALDGASGINIDGSTTVAITGATTVAGLLQTTTTTQATTSTTGSLITLGGLGVAKNMKIGLTMKSGSLETILSTAEATSSTTGALLTAGGLAVSNSAHVGGTMIISGISTLASVSATSFITASNTISTAKTTQATTSSTGSLLASGGLGVTKKMVVGGHLTVEGKLYYSQDVTPAGASATCTQGQIHWDADYVYVCVSANIWKRAALDAWA
jgi:hypothetical protein